jgi:hypothetical protein
MRRRRLRAEEDQWVCMFYFPPMTVDRQEIVDMYHPSHSFHACT